MKHRSREAARLQIETSLDHLGRVRDFVEASLGSLGLPADAAGELLLAVDEAVSNIVMHGRSGGDGAIELKVVEDGDAVAVCIRDNAVEFDPTAAPAARLDVSPLDREQPGGFGIELIRRLVDEVHYRRTVDGLNELTLLKRTPAT